MTGTRRGAWGVAFILASGVAFGSMAIFGRFAYAAGADAETILLLRFAAAAAVFWVLVAARGHRLPDRRSILHLAAMGGLGYVGQSWCYFGAIRHASAGLVALLLYLFPALVALLSRFLFGHRLTRPQLVALGLAFAGSALTAGEPGGGEALGIGLAVLGALIYACYIVAGSRLAKEVTPTVASAVITTSAAAVFALVGAVRGLRPPAGAAGWGAVAAIALVCTVLAVSLFLAGLERIGAVRTSIYSTVEPVSTVLMAWLVLGEPVTLLRLAGGALILGAVILLARFEAA